MLCGRPISTKLPEVINLSVMIWKSETPIPRETEKSTQTEKDAQVTVIFKKGE